MPVRIIANYDNHHSCVNTPKYFLRDVGFLVSRVIEGMETQLLVRAVGVAEEKNLSVEDPAAEAADELIRAFTIYSDNLAVEVVEPSGAEHELF